MNLHSAGAVYCQFGAENFSEEERLLLMMLPKT